MQSKKELDAQAEAFYKELVKEAEAFYKELVKELVTEGCETTGIHEWKAYETIGGIQSIWCLGCGHNWSPNQEEREEVATEDEYE